MDVLEIRFRWAPDGWQLQLALPQKIYPWRRWAGRGNPDGLFLSLIEQAPHLEHQGPFALRLRRFDVPTDYGSLPPGLDFGRLYDSQGTHLLDKGWTAMELVAKPRSGGTTGVVAVLDDSRLASDLRQQLGPRVNLTTADELTTQSIVVVAGDHQEDRATEIQQQAHALECPIVVWCGRNVPPRSPLTEVIPVLGVCPKEPHSLWLLRFLPMLLASQPPDVAFARAGLNGPAADRAARCLRGMLDSLHMMSAPINSLLPTDWWARLDRSRQDARLNRLVDILTEPGGARRIQVIITPGPASSGLSMFRRRQPRLAGGWELIDWGEFGWTDSLTSQHKMLLRRIGATSLLELANHMVHEAVERCRHGGRGKDAQALFWIRHLTVAVYETVGLRCIKPAELKAYLVSLKEVASRIHDKVLRVLVHISVQGATTQQLESLRGEDSGLRVDVLTELSPGVPEDELRDWLSDTNIQHYSDEDVQHMLGLSYDELVQYLFTRFPEIRRL